jgi:lipopolysaccharide export system protein LptC
MSKTQKSFTILLSIVALVLIGLTQTDNNRNEQMAIEYNTEEPTYQSQHMVTLAYEPTGMLGYRLVAEEVKHYAELKDTWFTKPLVTVFNKNTDPGWTIKADQAKLTNSRQLYLYGHIEVNNLEENPQIKQIITDSAHIDLVTQNISSDSEVTLLGPFFSSNGLKMTGNLKEKTANLIDNVTTKYLPQS